MLSICALMLVNVCKFFEKTNPSWNCGRVDHPELPTDVGSNTGSWPTLREGWSISASSRSNTASSGRRSLPRFGGP